jgi:hypothetical protein
MPNDDNTSDARSEADWMGDIGWRTLERLELLTRELPTLSRQFEMMHDYAHRHGLDELAARLYDAGAAASHAQYALPDESAVRLLISSTGREKQAYHAQG